MIKILIMDVDGVLSDGKIIYDETGKEIKNFDVKDGFGINMARKAGLHLCIISGRKSKVTELRARELLIEDVYQGVEDKLKTFEKVMHIKKLLPEEAAFIGDDLNDIRLMNAVGLSAAVADAAEETRKAAKIVLENKGGSGAVREFVEKILILNGIWEKTLNAYY
ncbi:MAG: HAD-IIIA family hydrolase [Flexistipes sinusarabici]|uniref:HAD-IIIA family hydrolase n=1 Tax=Flexistipes sinusarabici TaxID=2352 RepID=A0A5D0MHY8_FLESI|nr:HAD-IIIA family hydrolase [Flexistipes sinusarabici]TYB33324.1 MAG: HAD-IIIA family hydrolase [Flexistipes sinusarabici]